MAVKTEIWVKAHLRRCFAAGLTAVVARRGADEAGTVFVKVSQQGGVARLFGPAPGPAYDDSGARRWIAPLGLASLTEAEVDTFLGRQAAFDPDIWVLDIEDNAGFGLLDIPTTRREGE